MREGYLHIRFADAFNLYMGKTPDRDNSEYWKDGIHPWVAIADMKGGKYITDTKEKLPQIAVDNTKIHCVKEGTVIMSFKLSIGKTAIAPFDLYTNEAIMAFEPKEGVEVLPDWLYYYLPQYQWNANKAVKGTTINKNIISNAFLDIPSFSTQELIVRELDSISSVISAKKQQVLELDNLAQAIFLDTFGDPITNPKGWEIVKLGSLFSIGSSKRVYQSEWQNKGVPFYRAREVVKLARDGYVNNELFISEELFEKYSKIYGLPQEDDILVTAVGTLGITYIVKKSDRFYYKDGNIICLHKNSDVNSIYVDFCFKMPFVRSQIDNWNGATVGTYTIEKANQTKIPLPPLSLQQAFAEKVQAIEEQKRLINQSIAEFESLLAQRMEFHFA